VLGSYDYEKEILREGECVQDNINSEIVVRGKLKYLSKMFAEIDIHQTIELIHVQRQAELQRRVEKILQQIGEASTESDHLLFKINQMASKYADTDIVKQQLEMEFQLLQEKAKRLQITPIIT
jgi:ABC-type proline/glycine betaine transport system ATPase subunit